MTIGKQRNGTNTVGCASASRASSPGSTTTPARRLTTIT